MANALTLLVIHVALYCFCYYFIKVTEIVRWYDKLIIIATLCTAIIHSLSPSRNHGFNMAGPAIPAAQQNTLLTIRLS